MIRFSIARCKPQCAHDCCEPDAAARAYLRVTRPRAGEGAACAGAASAGGLVPGLHTVCVETPRMFPAISIAETKERGRHMAGIIFINYRREASLKDAQLLHAHLGRHFPPKRLFIDVSSLNGGLNWLQELGRQVAASDMMLVLIGKGWVDALDGQGKRRLDDRNDFVRFEIAEALRRDMKILPILIDGAPRPRADELPQDIRLLIYQPGNSAAYRWLRYARGPHRRPHQRASRSAPEPRPPLLARGRGSGGATGGGDRHRSRADLR